MDSSNTDNLISSIRRLASGKNRSTTARIRQIFDEIEAALKAGVRRKDLHQSLVENGFDELTFRAFELAIYRIRKERIRVSAGIGKGISVSNSEQAPLTGGNPLRVLNGQPKPHVFSAIPQAKIEIDP